MDQLKEFFRLAARHRFWIAIGISALLPLIAYFVGSGPIKAEAQKAETEDKAAYDDVQKYRSPGLPNAQYKPIADQKYEQLNQDVNAAWRALYERQAPLLEWPTSDLQDYFRSWGRKWPEAEDVDANLVQNVIIEYVNAYPTMVDRVYDSFAPWKATDPSEIATQYTDLAKKDPLKAEEFKKKAEAGTGLVAAPTKEILLKPSVFTTTTPPTLGEVWEAQEKLWVQGALLDVIKMVNSKAKAKDWETAPIKQITLLEIGNETAQDQQSLAAGETLVEPEDLLQPGVEAPLEEVAADPMMSEMGGMYGSGALKSDRIRFIQPNDQYRVYPVSLAVLVDQNYVQNLLVEFENSPMSIQVKDFEMQRPKARVTKPQAGQSFGIGLTSGYAGMMGEGYSQPYMMSPGMMGSGMMSPGMMGSGMNPYGGMGAMPGAPKAKDIRDLKNKAKAKDALAKKTEAIKVELYDPYYNIVEVHIYGQARFYNPPPPPEEPAPATEGLPAEEGTPETPATPAATPAVEPAPATPATPEPAKAEAAEPASGATPPAEAPPASAGTPPAEAAAPKR